MKRQLHMFRRYNKEESRINYIKKKKELKEVEKNRRSTEV